jgi:hypothetical protein
MKTKLFLLLICVSSILFGQDSIQTETTQTRLIAFTPLNKIEKVNGLAIGVGMDEIILPESQKKTINGMNLDINPLGFLLLCFYDTSRIHNTSDVLVQNGLNVSLAGFLRNNSHNGINISMFSYGNKMNGISVTAVGNVVEELNGIYIAGIGNYAEKGSGVTIGAFNEVKEFKGLQIGITNKSDKIRGVQIGLYNRNKNGRNFQIGFWNKNSKRTLPLINF